MAQPEHTLSMPNSRTGKPRSLNRGTHQNTNRAHPAGKRDRTEAKPNQPSQVTWRNQNIRTSQDSQKAPPAAARKILEEGGL